MIYSVYNASNGQITRLTNQMPTDELCIEGEWHPGLYYVVDGVAVAMPDNPSTDLLIYKFNFDNKTWTLHQGFTTTKSRQHRNTLLATIDRVNPVWYNSLTAEQQTELAAYRQALLDVPQQAGFPESVEWPEQPTWL